MSEEEQVSVADENAVAVAPADESTESQEQTQETPEERRQRNDAEYNWAEMRKQMREKEREIAELRDQVTGIAKKAAPAEEEDFGFKDDDLIEGKHLKNLKKEINQLKSELKQRDASTVDERLGLRFPDYAATLTKENIQLLHENEPELAKTLLKTTDPYEQSLLAYKYIKNFVPQREPTMTKEKQKAMENSKKPLSVQAVTKQSAVGEAHRFENGLTPELKKQMWEEMKQAMKGS